MKRALRLYARWHAARESARGWKPSPLTTEEYYFQFAFPHPAAREVAWYETGRGRPEPVAVGITDETPKAWSLVYFFYDPAWSLRGIGVANVVRQIEIAEQRGREHVYLGYRIDACPSMAYKARYRPQERLPGRPGPDEEPRWVPA